MEWQVRIKEKSHLVDLPSYLVANTVISAKVDQRTVLLRWNSLHQTFFMSESTSSLERCFRIRNYTVDLISLKTQAKLILRIKKRPSHNYVRRFFICGVLKTIYLEIFANCG